MSLLSTLTTDSTIADERDSLGSGGVLESGIYDSKITLAYVQKASSGALGLNLRLKTTTGQEIRQTLWMTSGTAKGGKNYYEKDGQKNYLPGFLMANALALLTLGKEISAVDTEQKVVNVYSPEAKAEVPTKVDMLVDLLGKEIYAAVIKQTVDKTQKNDANEYVPTGETRDENEVDKFFRHSDKLTTAEIRGQATEPSFFNSWQEKNNGKTRIRAKGTASAGSTGTPKTTTASVSKKPTNSLFAPT